MFTNENEIYVFNNIIDLRCFLGKRSKLFMKNFGKFEKHQYNNNTLAVIWGMIKL